MTQENNNWRFPKDKFDFGDENEYAFDIICENCDDDMTIIITRSVKISTIKLNKTLCKNCGCNIQNGRN